MNRDEHYELIERYLLNKADPTECARLESLMSSDPAIAKEVEEHKKLIGIIHDHARLEGLRQKIKAQRVISQKLKPNRRTFPLSKVLAVAAGVVLLLTAGWWFLVHNERSDSGVEKDRIQLLAAHYQEPIWPLERGEENTISQAVQLHLSGRTEEGLSLLLQQDAPTREERFWAAEIMVHAGHFRDARPILASLSATSPKDERVAALLQVCDKMLEIDD